LTVACLMGWVAAVAAPEMVRVSGGPFVMGGTKPRLWMRTRRREPLWRTRHGGQRLAMGIERIPPVPLPAGRRP
jgi:hypothetical protein